MPILTALDCHERGTYLPPLITGGDMKVHKSLDLRRLIRAICHDLGEKDRG